MADGTAHIFCPSCGNKPEGDTPRKRRDAAAAKDRPMALVTRTGRQCDLTCPQCGFQRSWTLP